MGFYGDAAVIAAYDKFCTAVERGQVSALPEQSRDLAKSVRRFAIEKKCSASFFSHNSIHASAVIDANTKLEADADIVLRGKVVLYGKLERLGGKLPRAVIVSNSNDQRYSCILTETQAKELAPQLYEVVGLECEAEWEWDGQPATELKVREILPYKPTSATEAFEKLRLALKHPLSAPAEWDDGDEKIG